VVVASTLDVVHVTPGILLAGIRARSEPSPRSDGPHFLFEHTGIGLRFLKRGGGVGEVTCGSVYRLRSVS
jgi:hypothetical protein